MKILTFIKDMLSNYLIRKTYNTEIKNFGISNQMQINNLFANDGIELK